MGAGTARGRVVGVNGNLVTVEVVTGKPMQNEVAYVECGGERLQAEVIRIEGALANTQVFEDTTGVTVGMDVEFTGELLSATLAPGLLGMIYDGLQHPLRLLQNRQDFFLARGQSVSPVDPERRWLFHPERAIGDSVRGGSILGWVQELHHQHKIL